MTTPSSQEITQLLLAWSDGDEAALDQLIPLVSAELHRIARGRMCGERPGHTLQTADLIGDVYLRLLNWENVRNVRWQNRKHFFGVAAELMRRILADYARTRNYAKRGGVAQQVSLDETVIVSENRIEEIIAVDEALKGLAEFAPRKSQVVVLLYFGGLTAKEAAEALDVSQRTVERDWEMARVWLYGKLRGKYDA